MSVPPMGILRIKIKLH